MVALAGLSLVQYKYMVGGDSIKYVFPRPYDRGRLFEA